MWSMGVCDGMKRPDSDSYLSAPSRPDYLFSKDEGANPQQIAPSILNEDESRRHFPKLLIAALMEAVSQSTHNSIQKTVGAVCTVFF